MYRDETIHFQIIILASRRMVFLLDVEQRHGTVYLAIQSSRTLPLQTAAKLRLKTQISCFLHYEGNELFVCNNGQLYAYT